ncbi:sterol desaturase family protein [Exilibacterium tricleocarpae]|uniref:Sterol desaturase family protein n=1 Tax=Exilibacterium tricleocarpae TaxID=2591008 RepID=A0A545UA10_9GAMM|nr:sterol desaturase family protein [Exilibacterium tricleocarpae]TQV86306.1 sterol desaturase family protein [Exilibacterium tricleocarpae]
MDSVVILYATPFFLLLIAIELLAEKVRNTDFYRVNDAFGSLALGITSQSTLLIKLSIGAYVISTLLGEWKLAQWSAASPWTWIITFIGYDLTYYWKHRCAHTVNFWWAGHAIHHSSEEFNLTTALRQTSSSVFGWVFSIPLLWLGAPLDVFLTCAALNLVYQYWVHTRHIKRLGWLEQVMVTPSHHRVHHGQNAVYVDKNHGGVFIIWDKLFGTFQRELDEVPVIYGVRRPLQRFNPLSANFQVWASLIGDAWRTRSWWDKLRIWFMPTGWRPADMQCNYPLAKTDLDDFHKYDPVNSAAVKWFAVFQLTAAVPVSVGLAGYLQGLPYTAVFFCWSLVTAPLITTGLLLEGRKSALTVEMLRLLASGVVFILMGAALTGMAWWYVLAYLSVNSVWWLILWRSGSAGDSEMRRASGDLVTAGEGGPS